MKKTVVIGSGISGLAAATIAASRGHDVTIFEKNEQAGGRARMLQTEGFTFDMGPSWYWMPDVFERYYNLFGKTTAQLYDLKKLNPGFRIFFRNESVDIPEDTKEICALFEKLETGTGKKLQQFLKDAKYKYEIGMENLVYKPAFSPLEFINLQTLKSLSRVSLLTSMKTYVEKSFSDYRIKAILEFPILFLGGLSSNTPSLYSMMNHAELTQGTWYPMGGMNKIAEAMLKIAEQHGVKIKTDSPVNKIITNKKKVTGIETLSGITDADLLIASSDYTHTETLLNESVRNYNDHYWDSKTFAPSCLIFYLGVNKKIEGLKHHNLFFDSDFKPHAKSIYITPQWPEEPQFYVCCPSKTDDSVAPEGMENLFVLIPIANGLIDSNETREIYFHQIIKRIESRTVKFSENIVVKRTYAISDFKKDYNAYKGNAYGLANTLRQTAFMKPSIRNKKIENLFYCGHLTVPGPGLPPALISGQIAITEALKSI